MRQRGSQEAPQECSDLAAVDVHEDEAGHGLLRDYAVGARRRARVHEQCAVHVERLRWTKRANTAWQQSRMQVQAGVRETDAKEQRDGDTLYSWVCPVTRMSTLSLLCSTASAWASPHGTTCTNSGSLQQSHGPPVSE